MIQFLLWYLLTLLVGAAAFPLAFRFLPKLSDRGASLARPLGLLIWGYLFWLLTSLHILQNDAGGVLLALVLTAGLGALVMRRRRADLLDWLRAHWRTLITGEALFLLVFAVLALIRAAAPEISGTEKPMELAFINSILRSPTFPPNDPWLSGYAISYYYFGYVMVAMLARLSGVPGSVAFNLAVALWFALTALGAYGIVRTLLARWFARSEPQERAERSAESWALAAPFLTLLVSNIEGFLEMLWSKGMFWTQLSDGSLKSGFWSWLNIQELVTPPTQPFSWLPTRGGWWWWRASRVLQDFDMRGESREIIDEFPFFSYLLADLHPHVLAMPFVLLAVGLALNLFLSAGEAWGHFQPRTWLRRADFWLAALALGGLSFLNTWDFPIYVALICAVYVLVRYLQVGWSRQRLVEFFGLGILLGISGGLLYLPFYIGFKSQAGGLLPSLDFYTRGVFFWVMFATLLVPLLVWLFWMARQRKAEISLKRGFKIGGLLLLAVGLLSYLFGFLVALLPLIGNLFLNANPNSAAGASLINIGSMFYGLHGGPTMPALLWGSLGRRLLQPGTWLLLLVMMGVIWALLAGLRRPEQVDDEAAAAAPSAPSAPDAGGFVLVLALVGVGLTLFPEFFYLRDQFGWRMNTIFKFYFQAWLLWGMAAAFATAVLWRQLRGKGRIAFQAGMALLVLMGLAYPILGIRSRTNNFKPAELTLDGDASLAKYNPDDYGAIQWLKQAPLGVVAEAIGGSYTEYARMSTRSGMPTVQGWPGHESQWRGGATEMGSRFDDIERLYHTTRWEEARIILEQYKIRYIVIGNLERTTYRVNEAKFAAYLKPAFQLGSVVIYEYNSLGAAQPAASSAIKGQ